MMEDPKMSTMQPGNEDLQTADPQSEPYSLLAQAIRNMLRRKKTIALITALGTALGIADSLLSPPEYTSTTRIMPPQQAQSSASMLMSQLAGSGAMGNLAAAASGGGISLHNPSDMYVGMLNSRPVADALIQKFDLASDYKTNVLSALRLRLAANTHIKVEKSGFIAISVSDRNGKQAAALANGYTEQLRVLTKNLAVMEASQRELYYEEQLKRANNDLVASQAKLQQMQKKKGIVFLDAQARALIAQLAQLQGEITTKVAQLQAIRSYSTGNNPEVRLLESQIASLREQADQIKNKNHGAANTDVGLQDMAGDGVVYIRAEHELQLKQGMFDLLLKQYDAAKLDESKEAAVIQVVEPAIEPDRRTSPHRSMIVFSFTLLGFLVACAWSLAPVFMKLNPGLEQLITDIRGSLRSA